MEIALMIEGQNGVNWPRWQRIVRAAEDLGFAGLYRSDHLTNPGPPDLDALELWVSLTWLASNTKRIEFGPLVAPLSFRHPVWVAKQAAAIDDLSGGRLQLGLGAGWQEREHQHYGFDLLTVKQRLARFQEGAEVVTRLLKSDDPVSFEGQYYHLEEATLLPRPQRPGGPPIVIGGRRASFPLVARYAAEWNVAFQSFDNVAQLSKQLDEVLLKAGRQPGDVKRSFMSTVIFGRDDHEVQQKVAVTGKTAGELRASGLFVGTSAEIVEQLGQLAEIGIQRVMLQWLELDDIDRLEALASSVLVQA
jgi:F420-dependent oxidoreductase-like protein